MEPDRARSTPRRERAGAIVTDATFSTAPNGDRIRDRFAVFSNSTMYRRGRDVLLAMVDYQGRIVATAPPLVMVYDSPEKLEMQMIPPTLSGAAGIEFLQSALEAAWEQGLRPKNWRLETTEQVAAMDNHLQDMRRLVFGQPVQLPPLPMGADLDHLKRNSAKFEKG